MTNAVVGNSFCSMIIFCALYKRMNQTKFFKITGKPGMKHASLLHAVMNNQSWSQPKDKMSTVIEVHSRKIRRINILRAKKVLRFGWYDRNVHTTKKAKTSVEKMLKVLSIYIDKILKLYKERL